MSNTTRPRAPLSARAELAMIAGQELNERLVSAQAHLKATLAECQVASARRTGLLAQLDSIDAAIDAAEEKFRSASQAHSAALKRAEDLEGERNQCRRELEAAEAAMPLPMGKPAAQRIGDLLRRLDQVGSAGELMEWASEARREIEAMEEAAARIRLAGVKLDRADRACGEQMDHAYTLMGELAAASKAAEVVCRDQGAARRSVEEELRQLGDPDERLKAARDQELSIRTEIRSRRPENVGDVPALAGYFNRS